MHPILKSKVFGVLSEKMTFRLLKQRKETRRNEKLYEIFQVKKNMTLCKVQGTGSWKFS